MPSTTLLVFFLIVLFMTTVPIWPYSMAWGDHPSELIGMALIAVLFRVLAKKPARSVLTRD